MKRYNDLLQFIGKNYSVFIFTALFYSLWLVFKYTAHYNPELHSFTGRMIGQATLESYNIQQRVGVFYKSGLLFLAGLLISSIAAWRIANRNPDFFKTTEIQIINYSSLAGIVLFFFSFWGSPVSSSLELIYTLHKTVISTLILKKTVFKNAAGVAFINTSFYAVAFVAGFSVFFLLNEISVLFHLLPPIDLHFTLFISVLLLFVYTAYKVQQKNKTDTLHEVSRIAYLLLPLALLPTLSVVKDEIYMILNGHKIHYLSPGKIYLIGLLLITIKIAWQYKAVLRNKPILSIKQLVAHRYFPLLILGFTLFAFYSPTIEASTEMFEGGNYILPLMELQKFGVVPILEKFNAHLLSDFFFSAIYVLFNGLKGHEPFIYSFFFTLLWALLVYWLLLKFFRNPYKAVFIVLLFPFAEPLLSEYHIAAVLAIFSIHSVIEQQPSVKNYFLLLSCVAFLILWRMDIGYPALIATAGTLFIYWFGQRKLTFDIRILLKATAIISAAALIVIITIAAYRHINIVNSIYQTLNYLSSAQSYGYISLGDTSMPVVSMQYYIFPLTLLLVFGCLLVVFKNKTTSRSQRFIYTSLVFLLLYYFINFQRGIVAHTLWGVRDTWLSPFLFFILPATIYVFWNKKNSTTKFISFLILACFLIMNYKSPVTYSQENVYSKVIDKAKQFPHIEPHENITRCVNDMQYENTQYGNFKKLIETTLSEKQTFIDFSNTPMLYYFTEKVTPSHFYQNPLTLHNDYLQHVFIEGLKDYDAPLLVFGHHPETWWDNAIGVPNTIRHYRMTEYFYMNYEPFALIDNLNIWKRKDFEILQTEDVRYNYTLFTDSVNYATQPKNTELKELPYIWATYDETVHQSSVISELLNTPQLLANESHYLFFPTSTDKTSGNTVLLSLQCNNENPVTIELFYGNSKTGYKGGYTFTIPPGNEVQEFAVRTSVQYNWYNADVDCIAFHKNDSTTITLTGVKLLKGN